MHKKPLPPSYIPTYIAIPGSQGPIPSPAEQLSTYLGRAVEFIQKSPFEEDVRKLVAPPTISTRGKGWLQAEDVEYGVERAETGYADGYPVLIANESEFPPALLGRRALTLGVSFVQRCPILARGFCQPCSRLEIRKPRTDVQQGGLGTERAGHPSVQGERDCWTWPGREGVERVG